LVRDLGVFASIGSLAILISMIAAGVALRRHAVVRPDLARRFRTHDRRPYPPFGPIALACFIAAVLVFWRSQQAALAPARPGQPSSA
jgi:amino acid transporter